MVTEDKTGTLKKEIDNLKEEVRKLKETDRKLYDSIIEANKNNAFWNKVIGISTCVSTILASISLIFSFVKK